MLNNLSGLKNREKCAPINKAAPVIHHLYILKIGYPARLFKRIDFYHAAAVLHKHKTFCPSSLAVKNSKMSLDGQKNKLLFSWDLTWPPREKGLLDHKNKM